MDNTIAFAGPDEIGPIVIGAARLEQFCDRKYARTKRRHTLRRKVPLGQRFSGDGRFVKELDVWGCDVSMGSMGFLVSQSLKKKGTYWVDLRQVGGAQALVQVRVTRCVELVSGIFKCGAEFVKPAA